MQNVFIEPLGQDDNLGDSVLRAALIDSVRTEEHCFHLHLENQTSDYATGFRLRPGDVIHPNRRAWLAASRETARPVWLFNAGEWNLLPTNGFPGGRRTGELRAVLDQGGAVIVAGLGVKNPLVASRVDIDPVLLEAAVVSWRDASSQQAAGFGSYAPDWAFALGTSTSDWAHTSSRPLLPVTIRFDKPWPEDSWFDGVRELADHTAARIVTVAQVSRDAPRAVDLAREFDAEYLVPPSLSHAPLDTFIRGIYAQSVAVVSDRAHGLIIGASEGAFPVGTASDPEKIRRMLDVAGIGQMTGTYGELAGRLSGFDDALPKLAPAIDSARGQLSDLAERIREAMRRVA